MTFRQTFFSIYHLLGPAQQKMGKKLLILSILGVVMELFTLASFLPLLFTIVQTETIFQNSALATVYSYYGFSSLRTFLFVLIGLVAIFLVLRNLFNFFVTRLKTQFAFQVAHDLERKVLSQFLELSYLHYSKTDQAQELNRIANAPFFFSHNILLPLLNAVSESLILFSLLVSMAIYNVAAFAFVSIVITPFLIYYRLKKQDLKKTSEALDKNYTNHLKLVMQLTNGMPEIKVNQKEVFFTDEILNKNADLGKSHTAFLTLQTSIQRITEALAALGVCSLLVFCLIVEYPSTKIILLLSIYGGVSFRIIPSINRIFSGLLQIKYYEPVLSNLADRQPSFPPVHHSTKSTAPITFAFNHQIMCSNVSFRYVEGEIALNNVTCAIKKGEKTIITGPSGSGKTTLLHVMMGFLLPQGGEVKIDEVVLTEATIQEWRKKIGYVSQSPIILSASIAENIAFGEPHDRINFKKIEDLMVRLKLDLFLKTIPYGIHSQVGDKGIRISGGELQRIALARALYRNPEIYFLDEVTNQLDALSKEAILDILEEERLLGKTIILITHDPTTYRFADQLLSIGNRG